MVVKTQIIGLWSIDVLFGPGVEEDTLIAFRQDGTGWLASYTQTLSSLDTFSWKMADDERLQITGKTCQEADTPPEPSKFSFAGLGVRFYEAETPVYGRLMVAEFDQDIWLRERRFGFESRARKHLRTPNFD